jgi:hypothetical protein
MTWIKRKADEPKPLHQCSLPNRFDCDTGDMWACDTCGKVWEMSGELTNLNPNRPMDVRPKWISVSWFKQRKYGPRYACGCRIGKPQTRSCKAQPYPGARMIIVHGVRKPRVTEGSPPAKPLPRVPSGPAPGAKRRHAVDDSSAAYVSELRPSSARVKRRTVDNQFPPPPRGPGE